MFPDLQAILSSSTPTSTPPSIQGSTRPPCNTLLITDTLGTESNFLLTHFIGTALKSQQYVHLISIIHAWPHYLFMGRKRGMNLSSAKDTLGQLSWYGFMNEYCGGDIMSSQGASGMESKDINEWSRMYFGKIIESIKHSVKVVETKWAGMTILIDDVSVLLSLGVSADLVMDFLTVCKSLVESVSGQLVVCIHGDEALRQTNEYQYLLSSLEFEAWMMLGVQGLKSGYSEDISGQLVIERGGADVLGEVKSQVLLYRLNDNGVNIFAKGSSL